MTLVGFFGPMGSGKTMFATMFVMTRYCSEKIGGQYEEAYSNIRMNSPNPKRPVKMLTKAEFKDLQNKRNALVVMDEAYLWLDSRRSSSNTNLGLTYLILQSRKRGFDIYYTAQLMSSIDKRLFDNTNYLAMCMKGKTGLNCVWVWRDLFGQRKIYRRYHIPYEGGTQFAPVPFWGKFYDTNEIVPFA